MAVNIFKRGFNFIRDVFDGDDSERELEKSQIANSTPTGFFSEPKKDESMVFKIGEGLNQENLEKAREVVAKKPIKPQPGIFESLEDFSENNIISQKVKPFFDQFTPTEEDVVRKTIKTKSGEDLVLEFDQFGGIINRDLETGEIKSVLDITGAAGPLRNVAKEGIDKLAREFSKRVKNIKLPKRLINFGKDKTEDIFESVAKNDNINELFPFVKRIFPEKQDSDLMNIADDFSNIKSPEKVEEYVKNLNNIESSVVQIVEPKTGKVTYQTIPKGQLEQFHKLIDDTTTGIAGKEIDGKIYHITAKTPGRMNKAGAEFTGIANPDKIPTLGEVELPRRIFNINTDKLKLAPEQKLRLDARIESIKPELQAMRGKPMGNKEILEAAQESELLSKAITRDETLRTSAALQKTRERLVDLENLIEETTNLSTKTALIQEQIELTKILSSEAADAGRKLRAFSITAEGGEESIRQRVLKRISNDVDDTEDLARRASEVDFNNAKEVNKFYREFVKPTWKEIIDEYRYNNALSNPRTQARNIMSNVLQATVVRPAVKFVDAGVDTFTSLLTGKQREAFFGEVLSYYKGAIGAIPKAFDDFADVWKGKSFATNQDLKDIGSGNLAAFFKNTLEIPEKIADRTGAAFNIPTKTLESGDRFLMRIISEGEKAAQLKKGVNELAAQKIANRVAENSLFRSGLDVKNKTGQGKLLSAIDNATSAVNNLREKVPGLGWFAMFIKTPMNFAKQWIEFSPLGVATLPGSTRKKEQLAKTLIGSSITAVGAQMALEDKTTWGIPTDPKAKELFFASGKKPYSVKIGDNWIPMMYLGPWAFALALPAAVQYHQQESPKALTDSQLAKLGKGIASLSEFLSGQTFMEGIGNFIDVFKGDPDASIEKSLAFTSGQTIPWQGLVRYVSTIIDPVYRKSDSFIEAVQRDLPFLSQELQPYRLPTGEESTRNITSYLAPYDITQEKKRV